MQCLSIWELQCRSWREWCAHERALLCRLWKGSEKTKMAQPYKVFKEAMPFLQNSQTIALLHNITYGKCCKVINKTENDYLCPVFLQPFLLFMEPCESSIIGAYMWQKNNVLQMIPKEKVSQCKRAIKIDQRQRVVYLTILHNHDK